MYGACEGAPLTGKASRAVFDDSDRDVCERRGGDRARPSTSRAARVAALMFPFAALALLAAYVSRGGGALDDALTRAARGGGAEEVRVHRDRAAGLRVSAWNAYSNATAFKQYGYPWEYIVEPHRSTTLEAEGATLDSSAGGADDSANSTVFVWRIASSSGAAADTHFGRSVSHTFKRVGKHYVRVVAVPAGSGAFAAVARAARRSTRGTADAATVRVALAAALDAAVADDDAAVASNATATATAATNATTTSSASAAQAVEVEMMCKYVRRELRALQRSDRDRYLSAAATLYTVNSSAGQAMWGKQYHDIHHFVRMHMYWSGNYDCDHWHEGPGFTTSHVGLSLAYERSLQAVDPSVALPYWDYTIDSEKFSTDTWRDRSQVFSDDLLGAASVDGPTGPGAPADAHALQLGRWANVSALDVAALDAASGTTTYSALRNSYGQLRPPWVNNPSARLSRYRLDLSSDAASLSPPSCKHHWWAIGQKTWTGLAKNINGASHGSVHKLLGGAWAVSRAYNESTRHMYAHAGATWSAAIAGYNFFFLKMVFRSELMECPTSCGDENATTSASSEDATDTNDTARDAASADAPGGPQSTAAGSCACACRADVLAMNSPAAILDSLGVLQIVYEYQASNRKLAAFVDKCATDGSAPRDNVYNTSSLVTQPAVAATDAAGGDPAAASWEWCFPYWRQNETDAVLGEIVARACDWGVEGDMNHAGSPLDPAFWPTHPTVDRLWHWVRLSSSFDAGFDETWKDEATCYGHNASHVQPFRGLFDDDDTLAGRQGLENGEEADVDANATAAANATDADGADGGDSGDSGQPSLAGFYTNAQLYRRFDPRGDSLPYVYAHFEWDHCSAAGYCMNNSAVEYDAASGSAWSGYGCKGWDASYNDVGRDYIEHRPAQPQGVPPALWDADESFLTDPAPAAGSMPATLATDADADDRAAAARRHRRR